MITFENYGVKVSQPEIGFVFDPILVNITSEKDELIRVVVYRGEEEIMIERNAYRNKVVFDLSTVSQMLFTRDDLTEVKVATPDKKNPDTGLKKDVVFAVYKYDPLKDKLVGFGLVKCFYGSIQPGMPYKRYNTFEYFPGMPFTVPVLIDGRYNWLARTDNGTYTNYGWMEHNRFNLLVDYPEARERIVYRFDRTMEEQPGIFDTTFDHTFRGIGKDTFFINIRIGRCIPGGVYLRWIGPQGEWFYYMFREIQRKQEFKDQGISLETSPEMYGYNSNNWHPGTGGPVGKTMQESVVLSANFMEEDIFSYVRTIAGSPRVDMYVPGSDGEAQWLAVTPHAETFSTAERALQDFQFTLLLPKRTLQSL